MYPEDCRYTEDHEWVRVNGDGTATVGITEFAQKQLGDVVFVELPEVGRTLETGEGFGTVESVKAVSEIFAPVAGDVTEVNEELSSSPESVNDDPYGDGWFIKLKLADPSAVGKLMNADAYAAFVQKQEG